jgi:methylmalonyl-CoA mutase N-terminal domain/subunit
MTLSDGLPIERKGKDRTPAGIPLEKAYRAAQPREMPGEFPFTRGIHSEMYRSRLWTFRQYAGFGSAKETNERFHYLLRQGQSGLSVAFDLPTQIGYDSDDPVALGEVGKVGVPISCVEDLEELLAGIPLETVSISMTINSTAAMLLAFLVTAARRRGIPLRELRGTVQNDMLKEFISRRTYRLPANPSLRLVTDIFDYCGRELPNWNPISISGYHMREAGSTAPQEVGFTLANAVQYLEAARERGIPLEPLMRRISFFWNAHNHLLEEVAKFRAARRLWAHIVRDHFGIGDPECARMRFHAQTGGSTLTFQEPQNNAARVTVQALAAVLGGAQSLHTNGMDEALGLPGKASARTALRTQQILAFESGVADVADPLGGAPAIEALTDAVEAEARKVLEQVSAMGGALRAVEEGYPQAAIEEEAYRHQKEVESRERIVVGVNAFRDEDTVEDSLAPQRIDVKAEEERIRALRGRKAARPAGQVGSALSLLRQTAREGKNIMDALLPCTGSGATIGEMMGTLVEVFGEHLE